MLASLMFILAQPAVPTPPPVPGPPPVPLVRAALPAVPEPVDAPTIPHYNRSPKRGPLVTFVRHPGRLIDNIAVCVAPEGLPPISDDASVVVSRDNIWLATLPADTTDADIRRAAGLAARPAVRLEVRQPARPFVERRLARLDDRLLRRVPALLTMEPYERAKNTQAIYILNNQRVIERVPRTRLERRWRIPGGLENAKGWTSTVYRYLPSEPRTYKALLPVLNSFGNYQHEEGWTREYAPQSTFADVLTNTENGKVFEVRFATKEDDGSWDRFVAWSDASARPAGYRRPSRAECRACHANGPGTGNYGTALVSGADEVFSDPFQELQ